MEAVAIEAFTPAVRSALFETFGIDPGMITDLGGFESFVFARKDRPTILRITHSSHRSVDQIRAELDFIDFLWRHGGAVCRPVAISGKDQVGAFDSFVICEFEQAKGRVIRQEEWTPKLFLAWGQNIGKFHRLSQQFTPTGNRRPHWDQDENFNFRLRIPASMAQVLTHADAHLAAMRALPESDDVFGLIHCDAHSGNYFYDNGSLTFFDFDDSCYCHFGFDIATILFGAVLQPWVENTRAAQSRAAQEFLPPFLEGYAREQTPASALLGHMDLFLKIRELSLFGVAHAFFDPVTPGNAYLNRFMHEREERLAGAEPFVHLDGSMLLP